MPLPVTPVLRIPCWHTMSFLLPKPVFRAVLGSCMDMEYFYYLLHPVDLIDRDDIPVEHRYIGNIERLDVPLTKKTDMLYENVDMIINRSLEVVTLKQIAEEIIDENSDIH